MVTLENRIRQLLHSDKPVPLEARVLLSEALEVMEWQSKMIVTLNQELCELKEMPQKNF